MRSSYCCVLCPHELSFVAQVGADHGGKGPSCLFALPWWLQECLSPSHITLGLSLAVLAPFRARVPRAAGDALAEPRREISAGSVPCNIPGLPLGSFAHGAKEQLQTFLWFCKQGKLLCSSIWRAEPGLVLGAGDPTRIFYSAVGWQRAQERGTWTVAQAACKSCEDFQPLHCPLIQLS